MKIGSENNKQQLLLNVSLTMDKENGVVVALPVTPEGGLEPRFGRAPRMAIATIVGDRIADWQVHEVGWDVLHDEGTHGSHHARIVRFMREHAVGRVVFSHMGPPMINTLSKLGLLLIQVDDPTQFDDAKQLAVAAGQVEVLQGE